MNIMLLQFIMGIGLFQSMILGSIMLYFPGKNKHVSKLTGIALFLTGILIASELAEFIPLASGIEVLIELSIFLDLLLAILIWLICRFISGFKKRFISRDLVHLLPLVFGLIVLGVFTKLSAFKSPGTFSSIPDSVGLLVGYKNIIFLIYIVLSAKVYYARSYPHTNLSLRAKKKLLESLLWPFIIICTISYLAFWMMFLGFRLPMALDSDHLSIILVVAFVYFLTVTVLKEPQLFINIRKAARIPNNDTSYLAKTMDNRHIKKLVELLEVEKPFLDKKLSLTELATKMDLPANTLSQLINEHLGKNFHELINEYRLKEVKSKLLDQSEDHKTLLALAFEAGFQSKASFNRVFKLSEGITPSEYKLKYRSHPTF